MKAINVTTSNVIKNTVMFATKNREDAHTSLGKGILLATLKTRMMRGECVRFAYTKKDGSTRVAVGTLQAQAVEANVNGNGMPKRFYGMFAYLDLEKMAWRGFKEENFIGILN